MRVKTGSVRKEKHRKILCKTKGYRMTKSKLYKVAHESFMHAGQYAYAHRQRRQSQMRRTWITKISAGCKLNGIKYNTFMHNLKKNNIELNRKVLADIAFSEPKAFSQLTAEVR
jgi:large subunit ribosomal protein L20